MDGNVPLSTRTTDVLSADLRPAGIGDVDKDGKADVILRNGRNGDVWAWLMDGDTVKQRLRLHAGVGLDWKIENVAEFDGDGRADILWRSSISGNVSISLPDGIGLPYRMATVRDGLSADWVIQGVGDFNGDHGADILLRNTVSGGARRWLMNGATVLHDTFLYAPYGRPGHHYSIADIGDWDGDGTSDVFWQYRVTGGITVGKMRDGNPTWFLLRGTADPRWDAIATMENRGKPDLLWQHTGTGSLISWPLGTFGAGGDGAQNVGSAPIASEWQIVK
jgi:hypothetical protein